MAYLFLILFTFELGTKSKTPLRNFMTKYSSMVTEFWN